MDRDIEKILKNDKKKKKKSHRVLLLGTGGGGKTTFLNQMKVTWVVLDDYRVQLHNLSHLVYGRSISYTNLHKNCLFQIILNKEEAFTEEERIKFRSAILKNIFEGVKILLDQMDGLRIQYETVTRIWFVSSK